MVSGYLEIESDQWALTLQSAPRLPEGFVQTCKTIPQTREALLNGWTGGTQLKSDAIDALVHTGHARVQTTGVVVELLSHVQHAAVESELCAGDDGVQEWAQGKHAAI